MILYPVYAAVPSVLIMLPVSTVPVLYTPLKNIKTWGLNQRHASVQERSSGRDCERSHLVSEVRGRSTVQLACGVPASSALRSLHASSDVHRDVGCVADGPRMIYKLFRSLEHLYAWLGAWTPNCTVGLRCGGGLDVPHESQIILACNNYAKHTVQ